MGYLTGEQVGDWAGHQPADSFYCEWCLTPLAITDEGTPDEQYYCPNEMCYDETCYRLKEDEDEGTILVEVDIDSEEEN